MVSVILGNIRPFLSVIKYTARRLEDVRACVVVIVRDVGVGVGVGVGCDTPGLRDASTPLVVI